MRRKIAVFAGVSAINRNITKSCLVKKNKLFLSCIKFLFTLYKAVHTGAKKPLKHSKSIVLTGVSLVFRSSVYDPYDFRFLTLIFSSVTF